MGRVINTEPDKKGFVRSVLLKTQTSELRRPIDKLILLLAKEDRRSVELCGGQDVLQRTLSVI